MAKKIQPLKRLEQAQSLYEWADRIGWMKAISITILGSSAITTAVAFFQKLPKWVILVLVFIVAALLIFFGIALAFHVVGRIQTKIKDVISESPLKKRVEALEHQLGARRISAEQKAKILEKIAGKKWRVRILAIANDQDAADYAKDFVDVFKEAGWEVWGVDQMHISYSYDMKAIGLTLLAPYLEKGFGVANEVQAFADVVDDVGIKLKYYGDWDLNRECCELSIGHRGLPGDM
jgi:uncharacterized membrane protein